MLIPALSSRRQSEAHDVLQQSLSFQVQLAGGVVHQVEEFNILEATFKRMEVVTEMLLLDEAKRGVCFKV
jgi:hypothetical protein